MLGAHRDNRGDIAIATVTVSSVDLTFARRPMCTAPPFLRLAPRHCLPRVNIRRPHPRLASARELEPGLPDRLFHCRNRMHEGSSPNLPVEGEAQHFHLETDGNEDALPIFSKQW